MISKYKTILPAVMAIASGLSFPAMAQDEQADSIPSTVQLAFRQVGADEVLGGVSVLDVENLLKKNYINDINNGTISGYVPGYNGNSLWGLDADNDAGYLVLIDGVPRDLNNIPPQEVKEITFMKGAQAVVLYGSRAAKGVIYITTKRGADAPLKIDARVNTGWAVAKAYPEYLGAAEYMTLYNEARANDGLAAAYSQEQIYHTAAHTNPYRYPDVNMYSGEYLKKVYNRTDANLEISGGNGRARFYTNINYFRQGDFVDFGEAKKNYSDRFSVRGNVDVNFSDYVSAYVNASATFYNSRGAHGSYWEAASTLRPNRITPLIPISMIDPSATGALDLVNTSMNIVDGNFLAGTQIDKTNIFADYYAKGYNKFTSRQFQFDTGVNIDLSMLTPGLSFATKFAVDYATSYNTGYYNNYATFVPVWTSYNGKEVIGDVSMEGKDEHSGVQNISDSQSRQTMNFSAQFDYKRTFADLHNFHAMVVGTGWQRTFSGQYHRTSNVNLGFEVDYNFDKRYYVDLAIAGVHSSKLAPGHRQAWSPSASIGWRISQEDFLKGSDAVNELMLSASYSKLHSDMDISDYYLYSANYTNGGWYSWAVGGTSAAYPKRGENLDLTFVTREEFNVNLRGEFFNRMIGLDASFFVIKNDGLLVNNSVRFPSFFSTYYPEASFAPYINNNANRRTGFDFGVNFNKEFGEFALQVGVNGTYYDTKALKRDEIYENAYQYREGKPIDGIWGYRCEGFFATDEEAAAANQRALGGGKLRAGDLKYTDINNDGLIDDNDIVYLGRGGWYGAPFAMGVNITAKYKGFTLFLHGTGGFGGHAIKNGSYYWVAGDTKYSAEVRGRWTEATAATATYPRLTTGNGSNNFTTSDFWMYSTNRFDLAKVQLTYDFPKSIIHGPIVNGLSIYVSGSDLLTISKNRKIMETNIGSAPQSRFYNIGAKVTF
ncbi:MAG: SusC/RagA family TonB-linked outer membrane protein [Candidatus Homeothermus sp.]|nr:SusC/RagA family TonB-linked outer membrane protein [Candidatus Homeothermus sp.]